MVDRGLSARLHAKTQAAQWHVSLDVFTAALERSAEKRFAGESPSRSQLESYLSALHLDDLALACGCAAGDNEAWTHFVTTYRPQLYRAADAMDTTGNARELVDGLYGDLFGMRTDATERQSLFRYFHGRSSLATWLRAVLSQRLVDRVRERRRLEPIPSDESPHAVAARSTAQVPERSRFVRLMHEALLVVLGALAAADRLRLGCYYAQQMTLAQIGRLIGEHEATVSRQLSRTRVAIRDGVERHLRTTHKLSDDEISDCFASLVDDAGPLDLRVLLADVGQEAAMPEAAETPARKKVVAQRSKRGVTL